MENQEQIEWIKCKKCGYIQYKDHRRCLKCKNSSFETIIAKGDCKLITYTILKAPPMEFRDKEFYAIGIVEFENGIKALGQLSTTKNLKIGMKMKPVYKKICDNLDNKEVYAYVYEPL